MITDNGKPVPPPDDGELVTTLQRLRDGVAARIARRSGRDRRSQRNWWLGLGGFVLFVGGVALGGATIPALTTPRTAFTLECQTTKTETFQLSYVDDAVALPAREHPVAECQAADRQSSQISAVDTVVNQLISQGHNCGTIHTVDGTTWSFLSDKSGTSIMSAKPDVPLGPHCITVDGVSIATPVSPALVGCVVSDAQTNVYPGKPAEAGAICRAKGYAVAH